VPEDRLRQSLGNLPEWDGGFRKGASGNMTTTTKDTHSVSSSGSAGMGAGSSTLSSNKANSTTVL
jgi:hypothetical protein